MRARLGVALVAVALIAGAARAADPCVGIREKLDAAEKAVADLDVQRVTGDQRLLEVHAVIAALMAERMQMRVTVDRAAWEACSHRMVVQVNLLLGVILGQRLTKNSGDAEALRQAALQAAMDGGLFALEEAGAFERLKALPGRAEKEGFASGRLTAAAIEVLRGALLLGEAVGSDGHPRATLPLVAPAGLPTQGPLGLRESDVLFTKDSGLEPRAAELKAKAAQLDSALAALAVAGEREKRPSEALRPEVEKAKERLNSVILTFSGCKK